jgi:hypothetical protein
MTSTDTVKAGDLVTLATDPGVVFTVVRLGRRGNGTEFAVLSAPGLACDQLANLDRVTPHPAATDDPDYRAAVESTAVIAVGGFHLGDRVRIGKGKAEFTIDRFWGPGNTFASLEPVVGYSGTSTSVDRLVAVQ